MTLCCQYRCVYERKNSKNHLYIGSLLRVCKNFMYYGICLSIVFSNTRGVPMKPTFRGAHINTYFIKVKKDILFKVISFVSNTILPSFRELMNPSPKKLVFFRGKPFIEPFGNIFVICELLLPQSVTQR